ncbi:unnamed protein product [Meganyctiphanes norvegica]|uniref:lysozyme n=2 Tax=Meganyctiphanes norvegica TaxID=48144 RepID=A0AAV2R6I8_MEGNR
MWTRNVLASIAVTLFAVGVSTVFGQATVAPDCLGCICEASSACNATIGCSVPFPGAYFCGPFLISWAYWADAGKPVLQNDDPNRKGAFENCVNDLYCAAETVRLYLAKFSTDCNGDGTVNCQDYAVLHKLGGYGCTATVVDQDYMAGFNRCTQVVGVI